MPMSMAYTTIMMAMRTSGAISGCIWVMVTMMAVISVVRVVVVAVVVAMRAVVRGHVCVLF